METKDHLLISKELIKRYGKNINRVQKIVFIIGNIIPDINVFTYFTFKNKLKFYGHNFNFKKYKIKKYLLNPSFSCTWWYCFGNAIHYLCDAFTSSHNENIQMSILEHIKYERELHSIFLDNIKIPFDMKEEYNSLFQWIEMQYRQYYKVSTNPKLDSQKIIYVTSVVFQCLRLQANNYIPCVWH